MDHAKEFARTFEPLTRRHDRHRAFRDWVTAASSSLLVRSSPWHRESGEKDYMAAVKGYTPEELAAMSKLMGITTLALEDEFQDFLGHCFMTLELGNKHQGQFFTPYALSRLCAGMSIGELDQAKDFWTFQEPAVGSGGMVIALMEEMRARGINYQRQTYTLAVDVSEMAARMAYLQLSILGVPAQVVLGNTLTLEVRATWPTLFYGMVCHKLPRRGSSPWTTSEPPPALQPPIRKPVRDDQLDDAACQIPPPPPDVRRKTPTLPEQLTFF